MVVASTFPVLLILSTVLVVPSGYIPLMMYAVLLYGVVLIVLLVVYLIPGYVGLLVTLVVAVSGYVLNMACGGVGYVGARILRLYLLGVSGSGGCGAVLCGLGCVAAK